MIKTYRGLLADGDQVKIPLGTPQGKVGYRITKFQLFPYQPGTHDFESIVKIYKISQTTVPTSGGSVDFSDNSLLASGFYGATSAAGPVSMISIFEIEIFNQDIYVTHTTNTGEAAINYYIELEQVKLSEQEALVAIVKDLREEQ